MVSMYDPAVQAYREISDDSGEQFVESAKSVEADMIANPTKQKFSMYDPALDVYRELSRADAELFVASAKEVAQKLGITW